MIENEVKILIVEDADDEKNLVKNAISTFTIKTDVAIVSTREQLLSADLTKIDVVITDYLLGGYDAEFVIEHIKGHRSDLPIIILSGRIGEEVAVQAMKHGAWDYIMKDNVRLLESAIERAMRIVNTQKQLREKEVEVASSSQQQATALVAAGVVHDLNNILGTFSMGLYVLAKKIETSGKEEVLKHIDRLQEAVTQGTRIAKEILSFSKGEELEVYSQIYPHRMLSKILPLLQTMMMGKGKIELAVLSETPAIAFKVGQFEQILINLVTNGRDAFASVSPGVIRIESSFSKNINGEDCWKVVVSDSGKGFAEMQMKLAFSPFFTTKGNKGTGLGLAVVKSIVEGHGGSVRLDSEEGKGAKFTLEFPLSFLKKIAQDAADSEREAMAKVKNQSRSKLGLS